MIGPNSGDPVDDEEDEGDDEDDEDDEDPAGATVESDPVTAAELTLEDLLDDLAGDFADIERGDDPTGGALFLVGDRAFAHADDTGAAFRLRPAIVAAAIRTPDATTSDRGPDWVRFRPAAINQYALDRAQSWFHLAHRLATESAPKKR